MSQKHIRHTNFFKLKEIYEKVRLLTFTLNDYFKSLCITAKRIAHTAGIKAFILPDNLVNDQNRLDSSLGRNCLHGIFSSLVANKHI